MISKTMLDALNEQLKFEQDSAQMYLAMTAYCADKGLNGMAHWFRLQAQEETEHAFKIFDYILQRGGQVVISTLAKPEANFKDVGSLFEDALGHEKEVSTRINELMNLAQGEKDHASAAFLQWFVTEQVEEEASFGDIVAKLKLADGSGNSMLLLDQMLGSRTDAE